MVGYGPLTIPRFYYNVKTKTCQSFLYGGSAGNANNFFTKEECEEVCGVQKQTSFSQPPPKQKPNKKNPFNQPMPIGNSNKDKICLLPKVVGRGRAALPRFYFNAEKGKCEQFTFGGGGDGNANNFDTMEECEKKCGKSGKNSFNQPFPPKNAKKNKKCFLPKNAGRGREKIIRFYFNAKSGTCEVFVFGGGEGEGNANNFETKEECEEMCANKRKSPYSQPMPPKKNQL